MAMLEVNDNKILFDSNLFLNVKSLIPKLQKQFPLDTFKMDHFSINGIPVDYLGEDPSLIRPISDEDIIKCTFSNYKNLELLSEIKPLLDKVIAKTIQVSNEINQDICLDTESSLNKIIDGVDTFIQSMNYLVENIEDNEDFKENLPLQELQIHLLSVLKAIHTAFKKEDWIMLTDLLEYELKDNLTQWKILIIPNIKMFLS